MSRTTQYIGLTQAALDFVNQEVNTDPRQYQRVEKSDNYTLGMFDEIVPLGEWRSSNTDTKFHRILEIVQCEPWSGGPMIFTQLVGYCQNDKECQNPISFLGWVEDPRLANMNKEYDRDKGTMWV